MEAQDKELAENKDALIVDVEVVSFIQCSLCNTSAQEYKKFSADAANLTKVATTYRQSLIGTTS
jgi:hypothetical protein